MRYLIIFPAFIGLFSLASCKQNTQDSARNAAHPDGESVKEINEVAGVTSTPKSMDMLAAAEQHLSDGNLQQASGNIGAGMAALREELGGKVPEKARKAFENLEQLQKQLASGNTVPADTLHQAVLAVLLFSPIQIEEEVLRRTLEVSKPGGAIPKIYVPQK